MGLLQTDSEESQAAAPYPMNKYYKAWTGVDFFLLR